MPFWLKRLGEFFRMWCAPSSDDELASVVASLRQEVASLRHLSVARLSEEVATLHEQQLTMLTKIQEIIDGTGVDVPPLRPVARPTLPVAQELALLVPPVDDPNREENANAHAPVNGEVDDGPVDPLVERFDIEPFSDFSAK